MKVIQLCGMISKLNPDEYRRNFQDAENAIKEKYPEVVVINPVTLCQHITEAFGVNEPAYEHYMDVCLASLANVDVLVAMTNAHLSEGGRIEMKEAFMLGKEVIAMEEFLR